MRVKMTTPSFTIAEIADVIHGELLADDPMLRVCHVAPLKEAGPDDLTFYYDRKLAKFISATQAGVIVVAEKITGCQRPQIIVPQPDLAMIQLLEFFYPSKEYQPDISAQAHVADSAVINGRVTIFPGAYIGEASILYAGVVIHPGVVVGDYCEIGVDTIVYPNVTIYDGCRIGERCLIHAGTVIGSDGYAFTWDDRQHRKIPQVGIVEIGNDVEIGANNTIDRAALTVTRIADGVKTDNLVQVAHNVQVGENSLLVAQVGIAGSTIVGKNVILAGQAGVTGHLTIGDGAIIGPQTGVSRNIAPGEIVSGSPQMPHRDFLKTASIFPRLPEMRKTLRDLERQMKVLQQQIHEAMGENHD
ncbi:MAG: UDP-3-O-(3-hydroxymyristoyl)glucosamine N-acyltransferase [Xanthomonadaceae bacterium]|nr:UDP-3-O-(3-hydroxymyristoyl)glucosamine N-acyltransferase [Xanthomonadaceae bacterium]